MLVWAIGAGMSVYAQTTIDVDFTVDGISYKQMTESGWQKCVYVTKGLIKYEGNIVIPDSVEYGGTKFKVFGIGDYSFKDCTEMTSISFEGQLAFIGNSAFENCSALNDFTITTSNQFNLPTAGGFRTANCIGNRAFYGCHFKTITIMNEVPSYLIENPSYTSGITNQYCDWFEQDWMANGWPEYPWRYTTLIVPAPDGPLYKKDWENNWNAYRDWQGYFTNIEEWGADVHDYTMKNMYDTIPELKELAKDLDAHKRACSYFAYYVLQEYVDSLAAANGSTPDYTQLENAFEKETVVESWGTHEELMIPSLKRKTDIVKSLLEQAEQLFDDLSFNGLRFQYYAAKKHYEEAKRQCDDVYNAIDWNNLSEQEKKAYQYDMDMLKRNLDQLKSELDKAEERFYMKHDEARGLVFDAQANMAYLFDNLELFEKEMWDFINAFKMNIAGIHSFSADLYPSEIQCFSISGKQFTNPHKGVNIIRDSKGTTRKVFMK